MNRVNQLRSWFDTLLICLFLLPALITGGCKRNYSSTHSAVGQQTDNIISRILASSPVYRQGQAALEKFLDKMPKLRVGLFTVQSMLTDPMDVKSPRVWMQENDGQSFDPQTFLTPKSYRGHAYLEMKQTAPVFGLIDGVLHRLATVGEGIPILVIDKITQGAGKGLLQVSVRGGQMASRTVLLEEQHLRPRTKFKEPELTDGRRWNVNSAHFPMAMAKRAAQVAMGKTNVGYTPLEFVGCAKPLNRLNRWAHKIDPNSLQGVEALQSCGTIFGIEGLPKYIHPGTPKISMQYFITGGSNASPGVKQMIYFAPKNQNLQAVFQYKGEVKRPFVLQVKPTFRQEFEIPYVMPHFPTTYEVLAQKDAFHPIELQGAHSWEDFTDAYIKDRGRQLQKVPYGFVAALSFVIFGIAWATYGIGVALAGTSASMATWWSYALAVIRGGSTIAGLTTEVLFLLDVDKTEPLVYYLVSFVALINLIDTLVVNLPNIVKSTQVMVETMQEMHALFRMGSLRSVLSALKNFDKSTITLAPEIAFAPLSLPSSVSPTNPLSPLPKNPLGNNSPLPPGALSPDGKPSLKTVTPNPTITFSDSQVVNLDGIKIPLPNLRHWAERILTPQVTDGTITVFSGTNDIVGVSRYEPLTRIAYDVYGGEGLFGSPVPSPNHWPPSVDLSLPGVVVPGGGSLATATPTKVAVQADSSLDKTLGLQQMQDEMVVFYKKITEESEQILKSLSHLNANELDEILKLRREAAQIIVELYKKAGSVPSSARAGYLATVDNFSQQMLAPNPLRTLTDKGLITLLEDQIHLLLARVPKEIMESNDLVRLLEYLITDVRAIVAYELKRIPGVLDKRLPPAEALKNTPTLLEALEKAPEPTAKLIKKLIMLEEVLEMGLITQLGRNARGIRINGAQNMLDQLADCLKSFCSVDEAHGVLDVVKKVERIMQISQRKTGKLPGVGEAVDLKNYIGHNFNEHIRPNFHGRSFLGGLFKTIHSEVSRTKTMLDKMVKHNMRTGGLPPDYFDNP